MYLRHTTRRKDGKVHRYWQLVRFVRVGRKVVQQTVAHLGELDARGRAHAKALARAITGDREQPGLFVEHHADEVMPVRLNRLRLGRGRRFGDVWLGWTLWRAAARRGADPPAAGGPGSGAAGHDGRGAGSRAVV